MSIKKSVLLAVLPIFALMVGVLLFSGLALAQDDPPTQIKRTQYIADNNR